VSPYAKITLASYNVGGIAATVSFGYDAAGNLIRVTDPKALHTDYTYDTANRLKQLSSPDTGITNYQYDPAGNRISQTDARGVTSAYGYDALNRLRSIQYPDASLNVGFFYDEPDATTGCTGSFASGRLTRMTDASGSTSYCYDRFGLLTQKRQTTLGTLLTVSYGYDASGRIASIVHPNGVEVSYGRDALGRVTSVQFKPNAGAAAQTIVSTAGHLPFGPMSDWTYGNGQSLSAVYDQNYWIDQINTVPSAWGMDYATDAVGNITQLAQTVNGATRTQAIVYDNLNRLKEVREGASLIEGYSYDATGNRLSRQPGTQAAQTYAYGATSHRLGSVAGTARAYDAAGNTGSIASTPAIELIHDQRNRLTEYRSGGSTLANYQYSGRGERVAKTQGAATQYFVYDEAGRLIYEIGSGSPRTYLWSDDAPIAVIDGTTLTGYIVPDNLGTPRAITDSAGAAIWRWDQVSGSTTTGGSAVFGQGAPATDPDGNGTHVTFNPRFPGQYVDAESGLHYNYFRDYEPGTGRYAQSDPIGLRGGFSTYGFSFQMPTLMFDPFGLDPCCDAKACCQTAFNAEREKEKLGGAVVCCCEKKVACAWLDQSWPRDPDARKLVRACVLKHERRHFPDTRSCIGRRDGDRPDWNHGSDECPAYAVGIKCLDDYIGDCRGRPSCINEIASARRQDVTNANTNYCCRIGSR
jgi:RHS repeat-associated protein